MSLLRVVLKLAIEIGMTTGTAMHSLTLFTFRVFLWIVFLLAETAEFDGVFIFSRNV